jgi:hypothetical protein
MTRFGLGVLAGQASIFAAWVAAILLTRRVRNRLGINH